MARAGLIAVRVLRRPDGGAPGTAAMQVPATGLTVGRAIECDLVLDDPLRLVSRQHARFELAEDGAATLRCISATLPIVVNDVVVQPGGACVAQPGDRLRIGGFELQVERVEPIEPEAPVEAVAPSLPALEPAPAPAAIEPSPPRVERRRAAPAVAAASVPEATPPPAAKRAVPAMEPHADRPLVRSRIDQWFDLDTVADPWAPGSPLPALASTSAPILPSVPVGAAPATPVRPGSPAQAEAKPSRARRAPVVKDDPLMLAFLDGAGLLPGANARALAVDAAWMKHLGAVLRASTEGTLALLRSRAVTKRSIRAEGTRIAPRENNPLKFAPDAGEALTLLIDPQRAYGFLEPVDAVRDAHNDLLVHQLAMVAGMRAAAYELIARMGPEAIEAQQPKATGLGRWVPAWREAELWRRHRERHAHVMSHLDDDFEAVFGREFLLAYEAQSRLAATARETGAAIDRP